MRGRKKRYATGILYKQLSKMESSGHHLYPTSVINVMRRVIIRSFLVILLITKRFVPSHVSLYFLLMVRCNGYFSFTYLPINGYRLPLSVIDRNVYANGNLRKV